MKLIQSFNFGSFPGYGLLSCGFTFDEIMKELNKTPKSEWAMALSGDKELIDGGAYFALHRKLVHPKHPEKNFFYIIITAEFKFTDYEMCKLAHECLHTCQQYLPDVLDRNKEHEAEAYLHTHIMSQCLKHLRWKKKSKKSKS